ncbi:MAG: bifunctional phosphoribosylaminoimidazolecarboxamide formyltransferase/IMP cyclohydrolase [Hyphomicrobiales bacterium]|nr:bifunctional phosphoribosylaminoimidazolecarboxamide formyltransferase/IMP cyclohydrolase [Hyphomicrobiales bacterium]
MNDISQKIKRALISVSDKQGLTEFAARLDALGVSLISTGGTAALLREAGLEVADVSDVTGFPEMMDGRIKTLHPKVHGGLLAIRNNEAHEAAQREHGIANIDLLVVNLYPFEETVAAGGEFDACIENIDIGGPAMIRAAAKNHAFVTVVTDPDDYDAVLADMDGNGGATSAEFRRALSAKAFSRTAAYDAAIGSWFADQTGETTPRNRTFAGTLAQTLRYGENPHQWAAFYRDGSVRPGVATAAQVQGKELSYNNLNDTDAAFELVAEFDPNVSAAVAIIKHANPCGVATADTLRDAYGSAFRCDSTSAFGGIVALNRELDAETAGEIAKIFTEVVVAPGASDEAKAVLAKVKNLRLLLTDGIPDPGADGVTMKMLAGGFLAQARDNGRVEALDLKVVTKRAPSDAEMADLKFAFTVAKHVKSNAIVYVKNGATVGIGAGQMSRVDSARIAAWKAETAAEEAGEKVSLAKGSVVASDAFFPFADGLLTAVAAGATAVIQPGGSMRDDEVIAAADEAGLAMVFTGMRHFRH